MERGRGAAEGDLKGWGGRRAVRVMVDGMASGRKEKSSLCSEKSRWDMEWCLGRCLGCEVLERSFGAKNSSSEVRPEV